MVHYESIQIYTKQKGGLPQVGRICQEGDGQRPPLVYSDVIVIGED